MHADASLMSRASTRSGEQQMFVHTEYVQLIDQVTAAVREQNIRPNYSVVRRQCRVHL